MLALASSWLQEELAFSQFGDVRLDARFGVVMDDFLKNPEAPINQASGSHSRAKAAYRFFKNDLVTADKILRSHSLKACQRAAAHTTVLCVQDTTSTNYSDHHVTVELGHIGSAVVRPDALGLFVHTAYLLTVEGSPLGISSQKIWARDDVHRDTSRNARKVRLRRTALRDKESVRWLEAMEQTRLSLPQATRVINVCDREADIFELMHASLAIGSSFIIRAKSERRVETDPESDEISRLSEAFVDAKPLGTKVITVGANSKRAEREAEVAFYSRKVTLAVPERSKKAAEKSGEVLSPIEVWAVWAVETEAPPSGQKRISWLLLTDLAADTLEGAVAAVTYYSRRWRIEEFHKVLKSGCTIEECRLETADRLASYIASMSIIAHRLCELTFAQRHDPDASATAILSDDEWKCLHVRTQKDKPPPQRPPTIREAVRAIAQLGGFLGRKGDGEPGIVTLWRGWTLFSESLATWYAFKEAGFLS